MSQPNDAYDLVILGGGSGGYAAAIRATELNLNTLLVEKDKLGGTCLHRGCIPTKALLHAAEVADTTRDSEEFGIKASFDSVDIAAVNEYKDGVVNKMYKGLQGLLKRDNLTIVEGSGKLVSATAVEVNGTRYEGRHVLLASGSQPKWFPGAEPDHKRLLTSEDVLKMDYIPRSVVVLGGGVIGVEFASVWASFGVEVTIVEALPHLLPNEDEATSKRLERAFRKRKINFSVGSKYTGYEYTDDGLKISVENGKTFEAEMMLVAVGRGPVSAGLGYEDVGVNMDRGFVLVDGYMRTNVDTISAVGDLTPTPQFAHVGFGEGILVAERLAGLDVVPIDYAGVPRITYCEPEVASVGLTSAQAKDKYGDTKELVYDLAGNGKSNILKTAGQVKVITSPEGPVVGIHMIGSRVSELLAEAQLIYNWEAFPDDVAELIHGHPSQSEAVGEAHLALAGKPLHVHA